jgi:hypothetical protein
MDEFSRDVSEFMRRIRLDLRHLAERLTALTAALTRLEQRTRRTVVPLTDLAVGVTEVAVDWSAPFGETGYAVIPTITSGQAALGALHAGVKAGSKTTTGCVVFVANSAAAPIAAAALDVVAMRT